MSCVIRGLSEAEVAADRAASEVRAAEASGRVTYHQIRSPQAHAAKNGRVPRVPFDVRALTLILALLTWIGDGWFALLSLPVAFFSPVKWVALNFAFCAVRRAALWTNKKYPLAREFFVANMLGYCKIETVIRRADICRKCPYNTLASDGHRRCVGKENGKGCNCPIAIDVPKPWGGKWSMPWPFARLFKMDGRYGHLIRLKNMGCPQGFFPKGELCSER